MDRNENRTDQLPDCVAAYIKRIARKSSFNRRVRREVLGELTDHFVDALGECTDEQDREKREERGRELIEQFGDVKLLGKLIRRGKKRCRPPWKKALIRAAQAAGVLVIVLVFYGYWIYKGHPTIRVDYLAEINRLSRPAVPAAENAWDEYKKAIDLYVRCADESVVLGRVYSVPQTKWAELSPAQQWSIEDWISKNEAALAHFAAGSRKQHCWVEYEISEPSISLLGLQIPALLNLGWLGRATIWRAEIRAAAGRWDDALDCYLMIVRVGKHWQRPGGSLIEQLVGLAITRMGHRCIRALAAHDKCPPEILLKAQSRLEGIYADGWPMMDIEPERVGFHDTVQWMFTEGGPGGGHLIPMQFLNFQGPGEGMGFDDAVKLTGLSMIHAGRDETLAVADRFYRRMNEIIKLSPYQKRQQKLKNWVDVHLQSLPRLRYRLLHVIVPSVSRAGVLAHRGRALHEATITVLALRRWQLERGAYPKTLDELVAAKYLTALPADPYSAGPLVYRRDGDGFILYSVAADFVDDGGRAAEKRRGWGKKKAPGDKVFWPVQESR